MSAPHRFRRVRLRCGHCGRLLDTAENGIRGYYVLDAGTGPRGARRAARIIRATADGVTYRCDCGKDVSVSLDRVAELAPRAHEAGRDLIAGVRDYGLGA